MATTFYPTLTASSASTTTYSNATTQLLSLTRGAGVQTVTDGTIALLGAFTSGQICGLVGAGTTSSTWGTGAQPGSQDSATGYLLWITNPLDAVTISGTITANVRALESNAMANYGVGMKVLKIPSGGGAATSIAAGNNTAELGVTEAAWNGTLTLNGTPSIAAGDMIGILIAYGSIGGTSASGFTASCFYAGTSSGASGDTFVTFSATITEQGGAAPAEPPGVYFARVRT